MEKGKLLISDQPLKRQRDENDEDSPKKKIKTSNSGVIVVKSGDEFKSKRAKGDMSKKGMP